MVRAGSTGVLSVGAAGRSWEELFGVTAVGPAGAVLEKQINDKRKARGEGVEHLFLAYHLPRSFALAWSW